MGVEILTLVLFYNEISRSTGLLPSTQGFGPCNFLSENGEVLFDP